MLRFFALSFSFSSSSSSLPMHGFKGRGGRRESGGTLQGSVPAPVSQGNTLAQGAFYRQRAPREEDGLNLDPAIPKTRQRWKYVFLTFSSSQATLARNSLK